MNLVLAALFLLSPQSGRPSIDVVVHRASTYIDGYMKSLGSIAGEEHYSQAAVWEDLDLSRHKVRTHREREMVSDFLTVPVGMEWIGIRHVRQVDGIRLDPAYRGVWRETFDETTEAGRGALQDAFNFESTRYNIGDFSRSTNLPTFPLELLDKDNLPIFTFSKAGEEKIGNVRTWKIRFNDRSRDALIMKTRVGPDERFSLSGTLWIEPATGQVFRAQVEFKNPRRDYIEMSMEVHFRMDSVVRALVPETMDEHYSDKYARHEVDCHAEYRNFRSFDSSVNLEGVWRDPEPDDSGLKPEGDEEYAMKVNVRVVNVEAWVTGSSGSAVTDLKAQDFEIRENERPQTITNFSPVSTPYDVLLLFDRSGSTQSQWTTMQRAAQGFISNLRQQDRAGIANFDTSFRMLTRWTSSREQLDKTVASLTDNRRPGGTAFYKAVEMGLASELLPVAGRRRALIVLSDGRDNSLYNQVLRNAALTPPGEEPEFRKMLELAGREHVPVYIVCVRATGSEVLRLNMRYSPSLAAEYLNAVATRLEDLAEVSGGRAAFVGRFQDIVPLYSQISRELGSAYSIGYVSDLPPAAQGFRKITVSTRDQRLRVIQSREGYVFTP